MFTKYLSNNSYTGVFIKPRTVTKLRTLVQLRHISVATLNGVANYKPPLKITIQTIHNTDHDNKIKTLGFYKVF